MNEEAKAKAEEKLKEVGELINEISSNYITSPELIAEHLAFSSKFYKYSIRNQMLIENQNKGAQYVQSFAAWKEMGYSVNKGEHGMMLLVPVKVTFLEVPFKDLTPSQLEYHTTHSNGADYAYIQYRYATKTQQLQYKSGLIEAKQKLAYKIGTVFDISQTNYPKEDYPKLFNMGYSSKDHKTIAKGLIDYYESLGNKVVKKPLNSITLRGYYSPSSKEIVLNSLLEDTQLLSTLSHELGHFLHDHGNKNLDKSLSIKEFEADCISVILQSYYGFELTDSRKRHLAEHYREVERELNDSNLIDVRKEKIAEYLESALSDSMQIFRDNIEEIDYHVKKALYDHKALSCDNTELIPESQLEVAEYSYNPALGDMYSCQSPEEAVALYKKISDQQDTDPVINLKVTYDENAGIIRRIPIMKDNKVDLSSLDMDETKFIIDAGDILTDFLKYVVENTSYETGYDLEASLAMI